MYYLSNFYTMPIKLLCHTFMRVIFPTDWILKEYWNKTQAYDACVNGCVMSVRCVPWVLATYLVDVVQCSKCIGKITCITKKMGSI